MKNTTTSPAPKPEFNLEFLTEEALDSFWEVIVNRFPNVKTGDLSPARTFALSNAATDAVAEWIDNNVLPQAPHENAA